MPDARFVLAPPWRIDLVTETWPPEVNGVAMTLSNLVPGLRGRGHDVHVIRPRQPGEGRGTPGESLLPGWALPMYQDLRFGFPCPGWFIRRWRRSRPDLVHLATEGPLGWSALAAAERLGLPICSSFHTNFQAYSRYYRLGWLERVVEAGLDRFHRRCDATLAPSADVAAALEGRGIPGVRRMGRGVDTDRFSPTRRDEALRASWGCSPEDILLVVTGRLAREKNLDLALEVHRRAVQARPGTRLMLIGDGPERGRLAAQPGVHVLGALPHADVGPPLASCDLFLFPSLTETFGNVLLEALAAGLPSVSFRYAASAQHVQDGVNGRHVAPGDAAGFLAAALTLVEDRAARARMGAEARRSAHGAGWPRVVDAYEEAAAAVLARAGGRRPGLRRVPYPRGWPRRTTCPGRGR